MIRWSPLIVFFLCAPNLAIGETPKPDGGSPLCVWQISAQLLAYADVCNLDRGTERRAVLEESVLRLEAFIIENSDLQQWQLDGERREMLKREEESRSEFLEIRGLDVCDPTAEEGTGRYYRQILSAQSSTELRAWMTNFVSVPRTPYEGGCL